MGGGLLAQVWGNYEKGNHNLNNHSEGTEHATPKYAPLLQVVPLTRGFTLPGFSYPWSTAI